MTEQQPISIESMHRDGSAVTLRIGRVMIELSLADADVLYRMLMVACVKATERQREVGIQPMATSLIEPPRVRSFRAGARADSVLLELIGQTEVKGQPEISAFQMCRETAAELGNALVRNAEAARQLRSPS